MFSRVEIHVRNKVNVIANVRFLVSLGIGGLEGTGTILTETQVPHTKSGDPARTFQVVLRISIDKDGISGKIRQDDENVSFQPQ